ncbi:unnamed protein product [Sphenostylis stenocarpa]|uniref:chitinase n=1 Tax=Sphenostylis stenocarpa TaxID=92480 RepID=A0AA86SZ12_9FABA|nr:unnamed protein product [Sphenostylis stenocarpa]
MASQRRLLMLIILFTLFCTIKSSQASNGVIAIYWGQNNGDGTLTSTCDAGNYEIVLLAFLNGFGCGRPPSWNFDGHCGEWSPCTKLQAEIEYCQQKGIKVLLSLGGAVGSYSLCSSQDGKDVAHYLFRNFLSGQFGPLGSVTLDGIDLDIEGGSNLYWEDLVKELDTLRHQNQYFYLSAAPQSDIPDYYLDKAIKTGLLDYVFVRFYDNPECQNSLFRLWDEWTSYVLPNNTVFLGLTAAPGDCYIQPWFLIDVVLPYVKQASNYGGVMLWDRAGDVGANYSDEIKDYVPKNASRFVAAVSDAIYEGVSAAFHRILPNKPF